MQFAIDLPPLVLSVTRTWSPNQLAPVQFLPTPLQRPRIPIWVAGIWPHKKPFRRAAQFDGVYPQISGRALTLEDFQQILAFIHTQRTQTMPFDAIAYGRTSGKDLAADAVHVAAFAQAVFFHPSGLPFQALRRTDAIEMSNADQHTEVDIQLVLKRGAWQVWLLATSGCKPLSDGFVHLGYVPVPPIVQDRLSLGAELLEPAVGGRSTGLYS